MCGWNSGIRLGLITRILLRQSELARKAQVGLGVHLKLMVINLKMKLQVEKKKDILKIIYI